MSKMGSEKETIFTLYMVKHLNILEEELNLNLAEVVLEQSFVITDEEDVQKKKVLMLDMYGIEQDLNVEVIVENILTKSNDDHQRRLLKIIERLEKGIIIYQALGFRNEDVEELRDAVKGKDINLYFVQINKEMIPLIQKLNTEIHKLKVFENLYILDTIPNPNKLLKDISIIKQLKSDIDVKYRVEWDLTQRQDKNNYLLEQLQLRIPYFFPFHKRKSNMDTLRIIPFGFGRSGVSLMISIEDMRNRAYVELRFKEYSTNIYYEIKKQEKKAKEIIGEELEFLDDYHTIALRFKPNLVKETIDRLVEVAEKFVQAFCNFTFYWNRQEMWERFEYSL